MGRTVVDADGEEIGTVHDVHLVQDGPVQGAAAAFRVHGLVVGPGAVGTRLGYGPNGIRGPWMLRMLLGRRRRWYVHWEDLVDGDGPLRVGRRRAELDAPTSVPHAIRG